VTASGIAYDTQFLGSVYLSCVYALAATGTPSESDLDLAKSAVMVRQFSFEKDEDKDFDSHPDDWSRRRGLGFPKYVEAGIDDTQASQGSQSLKFKVNGGRQLIIPP